MLLEEKQFEGQDADESSREPDGDHLSRENLLEGIIMIVDMYGLRSTCTGNKLLEYGLKTSSMHPRLFLPRIYGNKIGSCT